MSKSRTQDYRDRKKEGLVLSRLSFEEVKMMMPTYRGRDEIETKRNFERNGYQVSIATLKKVGGFKLSKPLKEMGVEDIDIELPDNVDKLMNVGYVYDRKDEIHNTGIVGSWDEVEK